MQKTKPNKSPVETNLIEAQFKELSHHLVQEMDWAYFTASAACTVLVGHAASSVSCRQATAVAAFCMYIIVHLLLEELRISQVIFKNTTIMSHNKF